jgi:hypothetical protein
MKTAACPATDDDHWTPEAQARLQVSGGVVDPASFEVGEPLDLQPAIQRAGGGDDRSSRHGRPVRQLDHQMAGFFAHSDRRTRRAQLRAELFGLHESPLRQLSTRDSEGKAEVVLDARTRARLAAGSSHIDVQRSQALGYAVHGSRQPRRSSTDDHQVEAAIR